MTILEDSKHLSDNVVRNGAQFEATIASDNLAYVTSETGPFQPGTASASDYSNDALIGTTLSGRFDIVEVLGYGGMSVVYKARQLPMNRFVAIKTIKLDAKSRPAIAERFKREIETLCLLNHPNIVTVYDCIFGDDGQPYVVMDYLRGKNLDGLVLSDGPLSLERFGKIFVQVCSALEHAHKHGVIHRDLKPGNIMLMNDELDFVKVVDFGLARLAQEDRKITQTGQIWGSPAYMSPEQWIGGHCDHRSDLYSLGVVMYELLTGRDPFFGTQEVHQFFYKHLYDKPPSFSEANPNISVPPLLENVIFKALAKEADQRFQSATELREALAQTCVVPMGHVASRKLRAFSSQAVPSGTATFANNPDLQVVKVASARGKLPVVLLGFLACACALVVAFVFVIKEIELLRSQGLSRQNPKTVLQEAVKNTTVPAVVHIDPIVDSKNPSPINNLSMTSIPSPTIPATRKLKKLVVARFRKPQRPVTAAKAVVEERVDRGEKKINSTSTNSPWGTLWARRSHALKESD